VKDGVERLSGEDFVEGLPDARLGEVRSNELGSAEGAEVAFAQVVEDHDFLPALRELPEGVGADVACASGEEKRAHPQPRPTPK
jgi:hypothetical protein